MELDTDIDTHTTIQLNMNEIIEADTNTTAHNHSNATQIMQPNLADQWHRINASLEYEKQKQEHTVDDTNPNHNDSHHHNNGNNTADNVQVNTHTPSTTTTATEADTTTQNTQEAQDGDAFKKKRMSHYNEFHLIQAMKQKQANRRLKKEQKIRDMQEKGLGEGLTVDDLDSDSDSDSD